MGGTLIMNFDTTKSIHELKCCGFKPVPDCFKEHIHGNNLVYKIYGNRLTIFEERESSPVYERVYDGKLEYMKRFFEIEEKQKDVEQ